MGFEADTKIQQIAEAYSLDAVDFAKSAFGIQLNWTDESIRQIESILSQMHATLPTADGSEEKVFQFAKVFGSYVGEVFRKNHGATWGMVDLQGDKFPGLETKTHPTTFWPWGRVQNRLTNGPEDNVWHYYQILLSRDKSDAAPSTIIESQVKKSWWKRLFGS